MRTDAKAIQARMAAAQQRWAREDRERGYTTYRNGRPYHTSSTRRRPHQQQLKDTVLAVVLLVIAGVAAGAGI
jgi:hypothetical protein